MRRRNSITIKKENIMKNTKRRLCIVAVFALILGSAAAYAHNGFEHVMGTVTVITDSSITVETLKHTSISVSIDGATKFSKNDVAVSRMQMKVGDRVVIDAKETSDKKLLGVTVKLGAVAGTDHSVSQKLLIVLLLKMASVF